MFGLWVVFKDTCRLEHVGNFKTKEEATEAGWMISLNGNFEVQRIKMSKNELLLKSVAEFAKEHPIKTVLVEFCDGLIAECWEDEEGFHATPISEKTK